MLNALGVRSRSHPVTRPSSINERDLYRIGLPEQLPQQQAREPTNMTAGEVFRSEGRL
jgi:hypothetical protein